MDVILAGQAVFRQSLAVHIEPGKTTPIEALVPNPIRTLQDLLGHKDVTTTQIYAHVMVRPGLGVRSPLDG